MRVSLGRRSGDEEEGEGEGGESANGDDEKGRVQDVRSSSGSMRIGDSKACSSEPFSADEEYGCVDEVELDCGDAVEFWSEGAGSVEIEGEGDEAGGDLGDCD